MAFIPLLLGAGVAFAASAGATSSANKGIRKADRERALATEKAQRFLSEESKPYRELGAFSIGQLKDELATPLDSSPGFLYKQRQIEKTLHRNLAAIGKFNSGSRILKDIDITGRLASEEQSRRDSLLNLGLNIGTSASQNFGNNYANLTLGNGNNRANSEIAIGNNNAGLYSSIGNFATQAAGLYSGYKSGVKI